MDKPFSYLNGYEVKDKWSRTHLSRYVTPHMFKNDDSDDWTEAIREAINHSGGYVFFPAGVYKCTGSFTITHNLHLKGAGRGITNVNYIGSGVFLHQTGGDILELSDMTLSSGESNAPIGADGSTCYKAHNNAVTNTAEFLFWHTVSEWAGGFYHKHFNSFFRYCKNVFVNYDQNNLAFFGCTFSNFETGITVQRGEGPITIIGGSVEWCAKTFIESISGRAVCANVNGVYIEQNANAECPDGIESDNGKYDSAIFIKSVSTTETYPITITSCTVFLKGFWRFLYNNTAGLHLVSQNNNFIIRDGTDGLNYVYLLDTSGNRSNIRVNVFDNFVGELTGLTQYIYGYPTTLEGCTIYDPITKKYLTTD